MLLSLRHHSLNQGKLLPMPLWALMLIPRHQWVIQLDLELRMDRLHNQGQNQRLNQPTQHLLHLLNRLLNLYMLLRMDLLL